jgi:hypothetical protein
VNSWIAVEELDLAMAREKASGLEKEWVSEWVSEKDLARARAQAME